MKYFLIVLCLLILAGCEEDSTEKQLNNTVAGRSLPLDICWVGDEMKMPDFGFVGQGVPHGVEMVYINSDGDIVVMVEDDLKAVYEGDFCK
jgi:hypothetical protein